MRTSIIVLALVAATSALLAYAGTNTIPVVTSNIIRKTHINQYQTGITGDWVPRNSSGVATDDAGALGSSTVRWGNSYIDSITLGVATNNVEILESSGDLQIELGGVLFIDTDDTDDELIVGPAGSATSNLTFRAGDGAVNSNNDLWVNIDSDNDSTTDLFVIGKNAIGTGGAGLFTVHEDGRAWLLDSTGSSQTIIFNEGLGVETTAPDIAFAGNGAISSAGHIHLALDNDSNNTARFLDLRNNSSNSTTGTQMLRITEGGIDGVTMVVGGATPAITDVFKACTSADCTAFFSVREEDAATTSYAVLIYNDSGNHNGLIIQDEATVIDTAADMLQLDFSADNDHRAQYISFHDSGGEIGSVAANSATSVAYNTTSDARLKENETPIPNALQTVLDMPMYEFEWREDSHVDHGTYAQEMQAVYPYAVSGNPEGDPNQKPMSVDYSKLVPVLVAAVQELHKDNETLKVELEALKGSPLVAEFIPGPSIPVDDYTKPQYQETVAKRIGCSTHSDCKEQYSTLIDTHCDAPDKLFYDQNLLRLECRELTGYASKNIQKWVRR